MNLNKSLTTNVTIDYDRFEIDQSYHDELIKPLAPYNTKYHDMVLDYLYHKKANHMILCNWISRIKSSTAGECSVKDMVDKLIPKINNVVITGQLYNDLLVILFQISSKDSGTIKRGLYFIQELLYKNHVIFDQISVDSFVYFMTSNNIYPSVKMQSYSCWSSFGLQKNIIAKLYEHDKNISISSLEYIYNFDLISNYKVRNIEEYRLLFKYYKKINKHKDFVYDIKCLENACTIHNNTKVVERIMSSVEPSSKCLDNALKHENNGLLVELLLTKIKPSKEQLLQYCSTIKSSTMRSLINAFFN